MTYHPGMNSPVLQGVVRSLAGRETDLASYAGQAVLIVNTASRCGYTPQYRDLELLHRTYHDRGLRVLGFPCNDFGAQEPGAESDIAEFCQANYGVSFDMFAKVSVRGADAAPLFAALTGAGSAFPGEVKWNFEKFLLDRSGRLIARYRSGVKPLDDEVVRAVEEALTPRP